MSYVASYSTAAREEENKPEYRNVEGSHSAGTLRSHTKRPLGALLIGGRLGVHGVQQTGTLPRA